MINRMMMRIVDESMEITPSKYVIFSGVLRPVGACRHVFLKG